MSKRLVAAGVAAVALAAAAVAVAQPGPAANALKTYTDSQNRFTFQYPGSLPVDVNARPSQPVNIAVGAAAYECQMFVVDNLGSMGKAPGDVARAYTPAFTADAWKKAADGFALYKRQGTVQTNTVDTSKFWPVQRATLQTDEHTPAIAALQARPGVEVWQFCTAFDNQDHSAVFNQIIGSFAGPNDAAQAAQAASDEAARAAAQAAADKAAADAAAAAATKGKPRKNRDLRNLSPGSQPPPPPPM